MEVSENKGIALGVKKKVKKSWVEQTFWIWYAF